MKYLVKVQKEYWDEIPGFTSLSESEKQKVMDNKMAELFKKLESDNPMLVVDSRIDVTLLKP